MSPIRITSPAIEVPPGPSNVLIITAGNVGPPGPSGKWVSLTQAEYDALVSPDPDTLYVIVN